MDKVRKVGKGGWHPEGRESWRGDFKGINKVVRYPQGLGRNLYGNRLTMTVSIGRISGQGKRHAF